MTGLLTPAEAAVEARCSREFIYAALQAGELPGIQRRKPKGRWLIEAEALSRWVRGM
ncbi:helix-turn-helix domain-containing protein [Rhodococcus fascians]|nr:helix-turn-helix domain-containing protein [Rhodococcus fascians]MBY4237708.1 helix-turn-helix domain-containing protein [Rhodococcus fascians]MBY4253911.1 helix-turn-helix domain-containing protein [Rhodococcus fascians]MBY4269218.1 helix-turn-helix domain-containing protein [Rhodococcus fascians]